MSPYELVKLDEEYPLVFDEFLQLYTVKDQAKQSFEEKREQTRGERVGNLLARLRR